MTITRVWNSENSALTDMLYDKLKRYSQSNAYPFHMPGHKRRRLDDTLPYEIDITEINGFDYLHDPQGCIREVECKAERLFHAQRAFMLVNGATGGILAAITAMTKPQDKVIIARNCHKSVYHALELRGLDPLYFVPDTVTGDREYATLYGSVNPFELDKMLGAHEDVRLVVITSPTYEGVVSDIAQISQICHKHGARLLVDEAHGAHFPFDNNFPKSAIESGADVSVVSLHKTLPALTQTALLLTNHLELVMPLQNKLAVFETSSPSYVLMSSMDKCFDFLKDSHNAFIEYTDNLYTFIQKSKSLQKLKLLFHEKKGLESVFAYDIGKMVISTTYADITGKQLAERLREEFAIETEMSGADYVIAMTSVCDTQEGFNRLFDALSKIDNSLQYSDKEINIPIMRELSQKVFNVSDRFCYSSEVISFMNSQDRISLEYIYAYPPGIPLVTPGERISEQLIGEILFFISNGVEIQSSEKNMPEHISVADL